MQIKNGEVIVRAPKNMTDSAISFFVEKHRDWAEKKLSTQNKAANNLPPFTSQELKRLKELASDVIPDRVAHYAKLMNVEYGNVTIRHQKTRWGSCSSKGNLNFNCLLLLAPTEVMDSVIIHELCHRREMNHSKRFYDLLLTYCPDYRSCKKWLKENGGKYLSRLK